MIEHRFYCPDCLTETYDSDTKTVHICEHCQGEMSWDIANTGGIGGDYNLISQSLGMNPSQIAAHKKLFPGIDVTPDGCPHFKSVRQHSQYLDKIGMEKQPQKIRKPKNLQRIA